MQGAMAQPSLGPELGVEADFSLTWAGVTGKSPNEEYQQDEFR